MLQEWRALAVEQNGTERLLYMGESYEDVKKSFPESFYDLLTEDEQVSTHRILVQKWKGFPDEGCWKLQDKLRVPSTIKKNIVLQINPAI